MNPDKKPRSPEERFPPRVWRLQFVARNGRFRGTPDFSHDLERVEMEKLNPNYEVLPYTSLSEHTELLRVAREEARAEAFEEAAKIFNEEAERMKNTPCKDAAHMAIAFAGQKSAAMLCEKLAKAARASAAGILK